MPATAELSRCPKRGCPTRWRYGPDRCCDMHEDSDSLVLAPAPTVARRTYALGDLMRAQVRGRVTSP